MNHCRGFSVDKRLLILLTILGITTAYSLVSLNSVEQEHEFGEYYDVPIANETTADQIQHSNSNLQNSNQYGRLPKLQKPDLSAKPDKSLPFELALVGISSKGANQYDKDSSGDSFVLVQFEDELHEHRVGDFIAQSDIQLTSINTQSINVSVHATSYVIVLTPPNLLAQNFKSEQAPYSQLIQMSASDIGTRPRIIEHLLTLTPTPYIADGKLVSPGINPMLFERAGFRADDVLKTINGKRVTVDEEFEDIKRELKTASTLTFVVMRKGRLIQLFLDIPSEALELTVD